jgi:hypothetical protein
MKNLIIYTLIVIIVQLYTNIKVELQEDKSSNEQEVNLKEISKNVRQAHGINNTCYSNRMGYSVYTISSTKKIRKSLEKRKDEKVDQHNNGKVSEKEAITKEPAGYKISNFNNKYIKETTIQRIPWHQKQNMKTVTRI